MVYDPATHFYGIGHVPRTSLVKDKGVAQAVARHLARGRKRTDMQVLRVKPGAKGIRALETVRPQFGSRARRRPFLPRFTMGDSIPTFVPITPAGGRERLVDAILFFLENQDRLLPLVSSARSRTSAVNTLVRRCALSHPEAEAIMDLRLGQAPRESIGIFRAELREAVLR